VPKVSLTSSRFLDETAGLAMETKCILASTFGQILYSLMSGDVFVLEMILKKHIYGVTANETCQ
jgi:hypothetical protein